MVMPLPITAINSQIAYMMTLPKMEMLHIDGCQLVARSQGPAGHVSTAKLV